MINKLIVASVFGVALGIGAVDAMNLPTDPQQNQNSQLSQISPNQTENSQVSLNDIMGMLQIIQTNIQELTQRVDRLEDFTHLPPPSVFLPDCRERLNAKFAEIRQLMQEMKEIDIVRVDVLSRICPLGLMYTPNGPVLEHGSGRKEERELLAESIKLDREYFEKAKRFNELSDFFLNQLAAIYPSGCRISREDEVWLEELGTPYPEHLMKDGFIKKKDGHWYKN